jgi:hypothetical protein
LGTVCAPVHGTTPSSFCVNLTWRILIKPILLLLMVNETIAAKQHLQPAFFNQRNRALSFSLQCSGKCFSGFAQLLGACLGAACHLCDLLWLGGQPTHTSAPKPQTPSWSMTVAKAAEGSCLAIRFICVRSKSCERDEPGS